MQYFSIHDTIQYLISELLDEATVGVGVEIKFVSVVIIVHYP